MSLIVLFAYSWQLSRNKWVSARYQTLVDEKQELMSITERKTISSGELDLTDEVKALILTGIEAYEKNKMYLKKDITLELLSKFCNSNKTYVSQFIHFYMQQKFVDYQNSLRITYLSQLLLEERKYKYYSFVSLADESGFMTTQKMTRAFEKNKKITLREFITKLREDEKN